MWHVCLVPVCSVNIMLASLSVAPAGMRTTALAKSTSVSFDVWSGVCGARDLSELFCCLPVMVAAAVRETTVNTCGNTSCVTFARALRAIPLNNLYRALSVFACVGLGLFVFAS